MSRAAILAVLLRGRALVTGSVHGGLPPARAEDLFRPFEQRSADRSGLGLGLAISRRNVETNGGEIRARSVASRGCIFTIDLPRQAQVAPAGALRLVERREG